VTVAANTLLACAGTNVLGLTSVDWGSALTLSVLAAFLSLVTSVSRAKPLDKEHQ
jgi:hypothetical protein